MNLKFLKHQKLETIIYYVKISKELIKINENFKFQIRNNIESIDFKIIIWILKTHLIEGNVKTLEIRNRNT